MIEISKEVRNAERAIDAEIQSSRLWRYERSHCLRAIMSWYRDIIELFAIRASHAEIFANAPQLGSEFGLESSMRTGVLRCLKWALKFCSATGDTTPIEPELIQQHVFEANVYQAFADALKGARHEYLRISCDTSTKTIVIHEGGNKTGFDAEIVESDRLLAATSAQFRLTDDSDQLTARWTAGEHRAAIAYLVDRALDEEKKTIVADPTKIAGRQERLFQRPVVCEVIDADLEHLGPVVQDLILDENSLKKYEWTQDSIFETPLIRIDRKFVFLSHDVKGIAMLDDYMLRTANRVDTNSYSLVSGLREQRMIDVVVAALRGQGWFARARVFLKNPDQELDVVATKSTEPRLVLQLKSTLRPESPWEVKKRNEDLFEGIKHTAKVVTRYSEAKGFVITDGYRGDHQVWREALEARVPILTLSEIEVLARSAREAADLAHRLLGIDPDRPGRQTALADREGTVASWRIIQRDDEGPVP